MGKVLGALIRSLRNSNSLQTSAFHGEHPSIRCDQDFTEALRSELVNETRKFYPYLRMVLNSVPDEGKVVFAVGDQGWNPSGPIKQVIRGPRNLWFCIWGKSIDLAQALWKLQEQYPLKVDEYTNKIRVYDIHVQDDTAILNTDF